MPRIASAAAYFLTGRRDEKPGNSAKPSRSRPMIVPATSAMCSPEIEMM